MVHIVVDPESEPFWAGLLVGELRLQRCAACQRAIFYPRSVCPHCFAADLSWFTAAGTGTVYSVTVPHRAFGEFAEQAPFIVALVDVDEGVRMMTRVLAEPGSVQIGDRVRLAPNSLGGAETGEPGSVYACFEPVG
ncbi:hypothetical protein EV191_11397 [Tamaricihabitans halophyticus]|uniref:OB-fold protein n=1 Tax=Tamaricihabitans halophyticus TaxID=1262583 RepID=A0A4R2QCS3_9PSEU|nr:OB-fold domain-containing protein [Tamaricihabitans halophyticus]TCP46820.1 hypothetical protein EV191_11397 [Tamaricihabitans halophyticus]